MEARFNILCWLFEPNAEAVGEADRISGSEPLVFPNSVGVQVLPSGFSIFCVESNYDDSVSITVIRSGANSTGSF